jgi:hypothetical protein
MENIDLNKILTKYTIVKSIFCYIKPFDERRINFCDKLIDDRPQDETQRIENQSDAFRDTNR